MATVLHSLKELPQGLDTAGVQPKVLPGDLYWTANKVLQNDAFSSLKCGEQDFHAVLLMSVGNHYANVRFITTKIDSNQDNGVILEPDSEVPLRKPCIVLTKAEYHLRVPKAALQQQNYMCNIGLDTLHWLRVFESVTNNENCHSHRKSDVDEFYRELALAP